MFFFLCYFSFVVGALASSIYRDFMMLALHLEITVYLCFHLVI